MTTFFSLLKYFKSYVAIAATAVIGFISPAMAQPTTVPNLSFPEKNTHWGCHFYGTCKIKTEDKEDQ